MPIDLEPASAVPTTPARPLCVLELACGTGTHSAGVQRHVADLAAGLSGRGHRVCVACPEHSWLQRALGCGVEHVAWSDRSLLPGYQAAELRRLVCERGVTLLHAHNRLSLRVALRLREQTGCRVAVTAHTMGPYPEYPLADMRIGVSQAVRSCYESRLVLRPGSVSVVYGAVDTERFHPAPEARRRMRAELGAPPGAPLVLTVSRLSKKSGIRRFLEAAAIVRKVKPEAWFAVAGDGPPHARFSAWLARTRLGLSGQVHLLGDRGDIPRLLPAADVFVLPSSQEALGLALLEAMACGVPVVGTRVGGIVETFVDGESGMLADPSPASVAERILALLEETHTARRLAEAGRERVVQGFRLEQAIDRHEELYGELVGAAGLRSRAVAV